MADEAQLVPVVGVDQLGIVRDVPAHVLAPTAWSNGRNISFKNGSANKRKGSVKVFPDLLDMKLASNGNSAGFVDSDQIIHIDYWAEPSVAKYVMVVRRPETGSGEFQIYVLDDDGRVTNVTPGGGLNITNTLDGNNYRIENKDWQSTFFTGGRNFVINDGFHAPHFYNLDENTFAILPGWNYAVSGTDKGTTCKVIRGFGNVLIAGNITVYNSGTSDNTIDVASPGTIRISNLAPVGSLPQTWQPLSAGGTADEFELSTTSAIQEIVDLQGSAIVYTDNSIHSIQLDAQGNANVRNIADGYGTLDSGCVMEFDGRHFVIGSDDIYLFGGHPGSIESVCDGRIREYFFENLNPIHFRSIFIVRDKALDEIQIFFPTLMSTQGECDEMIAWNYRNNTWSINDGGNAFSGTVGSIRGGGDGSVAYDFGGQNANTIPVNNDIREIQTFTVSGTCKAKEDATSEVAVYDITGTRGANQTDPEDLENVRITTSLPSGAEVVNQVRGNTEGTYAITASENFVSSKTTTISANQTGTAGYGIFNLVDENNDAAVTLAIGNSNIIEKSTNPFLPSSGTNTSSFIIDGFTNSNIQESDIARVDLAAANTTYSTPQAYQGVSDQTIAVDYTLNGVELSEDGASITITNEPDVIVGLKTTENQNQTGTQNAYNANNELAAVVTVESTGHEGQTDLSYSGTGTTTLAELDGSSPGSVVVSNSDIESATYQAYLGFPYNSNGTAKVTVVENSSTLVTITQLGPDDSQVVEFNVTKSVDTPASGYQVGDTLAITNSAVVTTYDFGGLERWKLYSGTRTANNGNSLSFVGVVHDTNTNTLTATNAGYYLLFYTSSNSNAGQLFFGYATAGQVIVESNATVMVEASRLVQLNRTNETNQNITTTIGVGVPGLSDPVAGSTSETYIYTISNIVAGTNWVNGTVAFDGTGGRLQIQGWEKARRSFVFNVNSAEDWSNGTISPTLQDGSSEAWSLTGVDREDTRINKYKFARAADIKGHSFSGGTLTLSTGQSISFNDTYLIIADAAPATWTLTGVNRTVTKAKWVFALLNNYTFLTDTGSFRVGSATKRESSTVILEITKEQSEGTADKPQWTLDRLSKAVTRTKYTFKGGNGFKSYLWSGGTLTVAGTYTAVRTAGDSTFSASVIVPGPASNANSWVITSLTRDIEYRTYYSFSSFATGMSGTFTISPTEQISLTGVPTQQVFNGLPKAWTLTLNKNVVSSAGTYSFIVRDSGGNPITDIGDVTNQAFSGTEVTAVAALTEIRDAIIAASSNNKLTLSNFVIGELTNNEYTLSITYPSDIAGETSTFTAPSNNNSTGTIVGASIIESQTFPDDTASVFTLNTPDGQVLTTGDLPNNATSETILNLFKDQINGQTFNGVTWTATVGPNNLLNIVAQTGVATANRWSVNEPNHAVANGQTAGELSWSLVTNTVGEGVLLPNTPTKITINFGTNTLNPAITFGPLVYTTTVDETLSSVRTGIRDLINNAVNTPVDAVIDGNNDLKLTWKVGFNASAENITFTRSNGTFPSGYDTGAYASDIAITYDTNNVANVTGIAAQRSPTLRIEHYDTSNGQNVEIDFDIDQVGGPNPQADLTSNEIATAIRSYLNGLSAGTKKWTVSGSGAEIILTRDAPEYVDVIIATSILDYNGVPATGSVNTVDFTATARTQRGLIPVPKTVLNISGDNGLYVPPIWAEENLTNIDLDSNEDGVAVSNRLETLLINHPAFDVNSAVGSAVMTVKALTVSDNATFSINFDFDGGIEESRKVLHEAAGQVLQTLVSTPAGTSQLYNADRPWSVNVINRSKEFVVITRERAIGAGATSFANTIEADRFGYRVAADPPNNVEGEPYFSYVERTHLTIGGEVATNKDVEFIQTLISDGNVQVIATAIDSPGAVVDLNTVNETDSVRAFFVEDDYKVDFRLTGRLYNIRFSDLLEDQNGVLYSGDSPWILSGYSLAFKPDSKRGGRH